MITLLVGRDDAVARWVGARLDIEDLGPSAAIGVLRDQRLIAGVVYGDWRDRPGSLEMTIASVDPRWCRRRPTEGSGPNNPQDRSATHR